MLSAALPIAFIVPLPSLGTLNYNCLLDSPHPQYQKHLGTGSGLLLLWFYCVQKRARHVVGGL